MNDRPALARPMCHVPGPSADQALLSFDLAEILLALTPRQAEQRIASWMQATPAIANENVFQRQTRTNLIQSLTRFLDTIGGLGGFRQWHALAGQIDVRTRRLKNLARLREWLTTSRSATPTEWGSKPAREALSDASGTIESLLAQRLDQVDLHGGIEPWPYAKSAAAQAAWETRAESRAQDVHGPFLIGLESGSNGIHLPLTPGATQRESMIWIGTQEANLDIEIGHLGDCWRISSRIFERERAALRLRDIHLDRDWRDGSITWTNAPNADPNCLHVHGPFLTLDLCLEAIEGQGSLTTHSDGPDA